MLLVVVRPLDGYKVGTVCPHYQIVVGAHRDSYPLESPGADDDGSGTAGVLEIARVLSGIDTRMTFVFILFDAEEFGLYGSWHYASEAGLRGDSIALMLNMDMIGYYENSADAKVFYTASGACGELWRDLADSLSQIAIRGDQRGKIYYQKKLSEGKTKLWALRCLKRQLCNRVFQVLKNAEAEK